MVVLGGLRGAEGGISTYVADIDNSGLVVGRTSIPGQPYAENSQPFLLKPRDANGDGLPDTWFVDEVNNATGALGQDGQNDLIIGLGNLPTCSTGDASAVNDLGHVVGVSHFYDPVAKVSRSDAFIVVPSGPGCWYQDSNADGLNDLMRPLGRPPGIPDSCTPDVLDINNQGQIVGRFYDPNGAYPNVGFVLTPKEGAWFEDDGSGDNALMVNLGSFLPNSINDSGQIVGAMNGRAVLRNPDGSMVDLNARGTQSEARAINNHGQVGLSIHLSSDGFHDWRAGLVTPLDWNNDASLEWYRDANGDGVNDLLIDLGTVDRLNSSGVAPHGLNEAGSAVGVSWTYRSDFPLATTRTRAPFLWKKGVIQSLKELTGGTTDFWDAYAINDAGQIICQVWDNGFYNNGNACILLPSR